MKKLISIILSIVLVVGLISGGVFVYNNKKNKGKLINVYNVSEVTEYVWEESQYSYGSISTNFSQELYPNKDRIVKEVYVKAGDSVDIGTPLLKYDTTLLELELLECQNNLDMYKLELERATKELNELKNNKADNATKVANNISVTGKGVTDSGDGIDIVVDMQNAISTPASYVDMTTKPFLGDGTYSNPYRYLCSNKAIISAEFLQEIGKAGISATFEVYDNDMAIGNLMFAWQLVEPCNEWVTDFDISVAINNEDNNKVSVTVQQENFPTKAILKLNLKDYIDTEIKVDNDTNIVEENYIVSSEISKGGVYIITKENEVIQDTPNDEDKDDIGNISDSEIDIDNGENDDGEDVILPNEDEPTYTKEELNDKITEVNNTIADLNLSIKEEELAILKKQAELDNYTITSTVSGVVKTLKDSITTSDSEPFLVINSADGYYVTGTISEMALDTISVGQDVEGMVYAETEIMFDAKIVEISEYPTETEYGNNGESNPNVSYYPFVAYIEDTTGLKAGDYAEINLSNSNDVEEEKIYLPNYFVKQDGNKNYVYIANDENRLEKVYVTIGKSYYGYLTEIVEGISLEDRVAFPYGKNIKEGAKTNDAQVDELYN